MRLLRRAQGINCRGFHADTMHMARLWDSSRLMNGGYSLEALTSNGALMEGHVHGEAGPKVSMKKLFDKPNIKKDQTEGKVCSCTHAVVDYRPSCRSRNSKCCEVR